MVYCAESLLNKAIPIPPEFEEDGFESFYEIAAEILGKSVFYTDFFLIDKDIHPIKAYNDIVTVYSKYKSWIHDIYIHIN